MFLSSKIRSNTAYSARISNYSQNKSKYQNQQHFSQTKQVRNNVQSPKVEFRKILITRNKHSRIQQNQKDKYKNLTQSRITQNSSVKYKQFSIEQNNQINDQLTHKKYQSQKSQNKHVQLSQNTNQMGLKKLSFIDRFNNTKLSNNPSKETPILIRQKVKDSHQRVKSSRISSSLSQQQKQNFKFIKNNKNSQIQEKSINQNLKNNRINQNDKSSRPLSSASSYSSFSRLKTGNREDVQIKDENKTVSNRFQESQRNYFLSKSKKKKQLKTYTLKQVLQEFEYTEVKINNLISEKWNLIEQKLMSQKQSLQRINSKLKFNKSAQNNRQSQSRISKKSQSRLSKQSSNQFKKQQKYSFSRVILQKNIDMEIMSEIKKLRNINFNNLLFTQQQQQSNNCQSIKQTLQTKRTQIIQKALAQSMVEAQLLKKYYSGQNYNGLSTSNHKVGQQTNKNKIILKGNKSNLNQQNQNIKKSQSRIPQQRDSITKQSQNKAKYTAHQQQDFQKYRYKQPIFKPNLQPLPRSAYKSQFFSYGNIKAFYDPCKSQQNIIFSGNYGLKNSSYRSQYKKISAQSIDYRDFDAYHDKYKQLDIMYLPKKRSQSQANASKKQKNIKKFASQLEYVKKLKTQSTINDNKHKQLTQKLASKMFLTQSRKQYQNPQKSPQKFLKSQIKNKHLYDLKFDLKKKFHA